MALDQKLSELPVASAIGGNDACLLVSNGNDYQFAMSLLLQYIGTNITSGASISFGTNLPQNSIGKNGDVFINMTSGAIAQKTAGIWSVYYTPQALSGLSNNTIIYGLGYPLSASGNDGDTYISTSNGIFYKKAAGVWNQAFSMQSGPAGAQGVKGDPGIAGADGNSLLSGPMNPSNQAIGKNGDFYLNTNTFKLFGPQNNEDWGDGVNLIQAPPEPVILDFPAGVSTPIIISNYQALYPDYGNHPTLLIQEKSDAVSSRDRNDIQVIKTYTGNQLDNISIDIPGDDNGLTVTHLQLIIKQ